MASETVKEGYNLRFLIKWSFLRATFQMLDNFRAYVADIISQITSTRVKVQGLSDGYRFLCSMHEKLQHMKFPEPRMFSRLDFIILHCKNYGQQY